MDTIDKAVMLADLDHTFSLTITDAGAWCASCNGTEYGGDGFLESCCAYGMDPEEAIDALWYAMTDGMERGKFLVQRATDPLERTHFRWTGRDWTRVYYVSERDNDNDQRTTGSRTH